MLLGRSPTEFDIVFDGSPEETARFHENAPKVGKTAVTYIIDGRDHVPLLGTIAEDLLARDCTINALLLDENGMLHALPTTFSDLRDGIIRHASPTAFLRDPVRVFRAARFAAALPGFSIAPETTDRMREAAGHEHFRTVAAERVGKECMKAMAGHAPGNFIRALAAADALVPWFSPLETGNAIPAGPAKYHDDKSVLEHTTKVMDAIAAMPLPEKDRALAVWMGLCHDLGKVTTPPETLPRHIGHELRGEALAGELARRLRLPGLWEKAGRLAASLHMKAGQYAVLRPGTKVDLLHALAASRLAAPFTALVAADSGDGSLRETMTRDMQTILAVTLPEEWRDKGPKSAAELRRLRVRVLKQALSSGEKLRP
ncbi:conserved hypothetical protein [uncultured delta proteobacterium]|uniref:HD domain-containing protein n=1 Tax=uncultured delta proteobacterium TaxID=34034 RepID=A0A212J4I3_9DELT|nr:conserved hypothetical protein [uncultured delta proteobacterium]